MSPIVALVFPSAHVTHSQPSGPVVPALHAQSVYAALPSKDVEFRGHSTHAVCNVAAVKVAYVSFEQSVQGVDPESFLYFPGTHAVQGPSSPPVVPALHAQSTGEALPLMDDECRGHSTHTVGVLAAVEVEYVCLPQSVHSADPGSFL